MDFGLPKATSAATGNTCPQVAILLATYNGMPYLEEQIASIFAQINVDITLFVSDDGSTDGSMAFLWGIKGKKICILPSKIAGSAANNFYRLICDAEIDRFDYVALSDQDDVWSPRKLDRAITQVEKYKCGGYSSDLISFNENVGKVWYLSKSDEPKRLDYLFQGASAGCTYVLTRNAAMLVRKKISPALNTLPKNNSHDWLIYAICRSHGLGWHVDNQAHIYYRQHGQNAYGALPGCRGLVTRFRLAGSGWYRQHVLWLSKFVRSTEDEIAVFSAVERLGWKERIWLVFHTKEYRRRKRDRYLLALTILMGVF
jgi:rhamnosyltransferase